MHDHIAGGIPPDALAGLQAIDALLNDDTERSAQLLAGLEGGQWFATAASYAATWVHLLGVEKGDHVAAEVQGCGKSDCPHCSGSEGQILAAFAAGVQNGDHLGVLALWETLDQHQQCDLTTELAVGLVKALKAVGAESIWGPIQT